MSQRKPRGGWRACLLLGATILVIFALLSPQLMSYLYFRMPGASDDFDCDDSALLMLDRLTRVGVKATPVLGNLKKDGETYLESDHVWVLADFGGLRIPFDWGTQRFDRQYYEGYSLTYAELLQFVEQDRKPGVSAVAKRDK